MAGSRKITRKSLATSKLSLSSNDDSTESIDVETHEEIEVTLFPPRQVLKEVSIPRRSRYSSTKSGAGSPSDSIVSSVFSNPRDDSAECETLGTTPARSVRGGSAIKRKRGSGYDGIDQQCEDSVEEVEDADLALARQLQEQEYAEVDNGPSKRARKTVIPESDLSSESELSEPESDLSSIISLPQTQKSSSRKTGSTVTATRAGRAAKQTAKTAVEASLKALTDDQDIDFWDAMAESDQESGDDFVVGGSEEEASSGENDDEDENDENSVEGRQSIIAPVASTTLNSQRNRSRRRRGNSNSAMRSSGSRRGHRSFRGIGRKERERMKLEKAHPKIKTMWTDLEKIPITIPVAATQPASISRKLKSFQLEGLDWMIKQEKSQYRGGLLGDEMGMGKTIQAVSLIMSDYPQKQPSLVVVPPVALMQWSNEIKEYTDGKLNVLIYHGQNSKVKGMTVAQLKKFDVIMISYNSLESLYRKQSKGWIREDSIIKEDSPIHAIHFHRLVLDEAHSIKSKTTGVAKACFALTGTYKWCLSGTPVQNRIGEFFSLLRFLEVRPFADYFCKRCPCAMLHWTFDEDHICTTCKHTSIEHVSVFNQELLNPLTQSEDPEERSAAMDKLHSITSRIMLRRVKRDHTSSMELPPKEVIVHNEFFGEIERDFSSSIMTNTTRQFDTYVARGVMLNNYANIFGLIMQMRQVANHPDLLLKKKAPDGQNVLVCNICDEVAEEAIRSQCKHDFCRACVKSYLQSVEETGGDADCPRCHIALSIDLDQPEIEQDEEGVKKSSIINRIKMGDWTSSTKIEMLVYDLYKLRSKKQTLKSIVFSQFTSMLQLIEWRLRRAGFNTVMLDGSMTPIQRQRSIEYFMTNTDVEVFLVSLKAGGVALNLTEASRVFIVDPWWNPAAEWQSADRCHRIGQRRPCVITRLCIEDSVESRMVMLQEKKANMINGTINKDKTSIEKLTPEDMQFLFRGN